MRLRTRVSSAFFVALAALAPALALAHGLLRHASPAEGARLGIAPREIELTFNEMPERVFTRIVLTSPAGRLVRLSAPAITGHTAKADILEPLAPGTYTVEWQTAGRDGHPVRGDYKFVVEVGAAGSVVPGQEDSAVVGETAPRPPMLVGASRPIDGLSVLLRWLMLSGVVAAIGAVAFRATVLVRVEKEMDVDIRHEYLPRAANGAATLGAVSVVVVLAVALGRLVVQSYTMHGRADMIAPELVWPMLAHTGWGWSWLLQVGMGVLAIAGFVTARRLHRLGWLVAAIGSVGLALSLALSGHAVVVPSYPAATVVAHVVHTVAASGWLGNLLAIVAVGIPLAFRMDRDDRWRIIADIVRTFSPAALAFAGVAVVAGAFIAWTHIGSVSGFWTTQYGRILLLKLALLGGTALTGAYNWRRVLPALGHDAAAYRLRRSATVEVSIAAVVIAVTAVLVATPTPVP